MKRRLGFVLAAGIAVLAAAAGAWLAARAHYAAAIADRDGRIRQLNELVAQRNQLVGEQQQKITELSGRLDNYQARLAEAPPDKAAETIARLKSELSAAENESKPAPARNAYALYRDDRIVAVVRGANVDPAAKTVTFSAITAQAELDLPGVFQFKEWKLRCQDSGLQATTTLGGSREFNYYRVECKML